MMYLIAYKDKHGKDCNGNPWLIDFGEDKDSAFESLTEMSEKGNKDVTVFCCEDNELPQTVSWEFVNKHSVNETRNN